MSFTLKKFESQGEIDEKKRKRQEEWEKVRKPEDPVEAPEAPVDNRSLFERLEEQKLKKQEEIDEQFALKNQVKGLDEDETEFLDFVADRQMEILRNRKQEESDILSEMKDAQVQQVVDKTTENKQEEKKNRPTVATSHRKSQMALLAKAVKRKGSEDSTVAKKAKEETVESKDKTSESKVPSTSQSKSSNIRPLPVATSKVPISKVIAVRPAALPYMQQYEDSSDSISSSSDSEPEFSLAARPSVSEIRQVAQQHSQQ